MKKILVVLTFSLISISLLGCDLLSSFIAVRDFASEYFASTSLYENAALISVSVETSVDIEEATVEGLEAFSSTVEWSRDSSTQFTHLNQTLDGQSKESVLQDVDGLLIEYVIDGSIVTPRIPESTVLDSDTLTFNDSFTIGDIQNERKTAARTFEFDIQLDQVIDMETIGGFADQLRVFDENLELLKTATAHLQVIFSDIDHTIDITVLLEDYRLDFADDSYAVVTLSNHTILSIPASVEIPDIFGEAYVMIPVDDIRLARKIYEPNTTIALPLVVDQSGWIQLHLEAGTYQILSANFGILSSSYLVDSENNVIPYDPVGAIQVTLPTEGAYYYYLMPDRDFTTDIQFFQIIE